MIAWLYKWLPIVFGCHCRDDRSFHIHGKRFPICARCTGELAGILAALASCWLFRPPVLIQLALLLPMLADGGIQALTSYESTQPRRFLTGLLFGYALTCLFVASVRYVFLLGRRFSGAHFS